jgi:RNA-directed DNA polymerase
MMHGREKSDSAIVAGKPTNKAGQPAAEPAERRAATLSPVAHYSYGAAKPKRRVSSDLTARATRRTLCRKDRAHRVSPAHGSKAPS